MRPDILLHGGTYFHYVDLENNQWDIYDIAHALSNICRFGGHCRKFYSVAQHSVLVSHLVPKELALQALLHDAAEAFLVDIPAPLKSLLPDYKALEKRVEEHVFSRLGIPYPLDRSIKVADMEALATEQRDLMPLHTDKWMCDGMERRDVFVQPYDPDVAEDLFLARYKELTSDPE